MMHVLVGSPMMAGVMWSLSIHGSNQLSLADLDFLTAPPDIFASFVHLSAATRLLSPMRHILHHTSHRAQRLMWRVALALFNLTYIREPSWELIAPNRVAAPLSLFKTSTPYVHCGKGSLLIPSTHTSLRHNPSRKPTLYLGLTSPLDFFS